MHIRLNILSHSALAVAAVAFSATVALLASCSDGEKAADAGRLSHARLLRLTEHRGYTRADIVNPWDTTRLLQTLVIVTDSSAAGPLPEGTVVRVPLCRSLVMTTVHCSILDELGRAPSIAGVCDAPYISVPYIIKGVAARRIADCGTATSPTMERVIALRPDAILVSPYEQSDFTKLRNLGTPVVLLADYMEPTPLGRAEWVRLYGRLYGAAAQADSLFEATARRYGELRAMAARAKSRPTVLTDTRYGQTWYVPGASSTMGRMYSDAAARNPFADISGENGSLALAPERVLATAREADVWLIKAGRGYTRQSLAAESAMHTLFRPFLTGNVWACDTRTSRFFEEEPFHPDRLLADFIRILHPELRLAGENAYYHRVE